MPTELYGHLYGHDNLYVVMTMLKDINAKKPQNMVAIVTGVAQGATAPFTHICSPTRGASKAQSDGIFGRQNIAAHRDSVLHRPNGKPTRKPFKTFITQPRRRFKLDAMGTMDAYSIQWKTLSIRSMWKTTRTKGCFRFRRLFGKYDKNPTQNVQSLW